MALDAAAMTVLAGYGTRIAAIRAAVLAFIVRTWGTLDAYREADVERFVAAIVPVVEGGQFQVAALTDAYLAQLEGSVLGTAVRPIGVPSSTVTTEALRGVRAVEVYRRVGPAVWYALSRGAELQVAQQAGLRRATVQAQTGLQLAKTHASRNVLERKSNVVGYRRVLTGSRSCVLCVAASTRRYRKADLLPIHSRCDCAVAPVFGTEDSGEVIDPDRLESLDIEIAKRFGPDATTDIRSLRDAVVVHEHGELGPVLSRRDDNFRGPSEVT